MDSKTLIKKNENCTGCAACVNACPKNAISIVENKNGFVFPIIDSLTCIDCGLCERVCLNRHRTIRPSSDQQYFFGQSKNQEVLVKSASGGIFAELALSVLRQEGIVFGASLSMNNGVCSVSHISIDRKEQLNLLQNSKYVQSEIGLSYSECKKYLTDGKQVLFSGTPCQIAGLKSFLGKDYPNLLTVDIVCHGVPSISFYNKYLEYTQKRKRIKINSILFRDKKYGWGFKGKLVYTNRFGHRKESVWNSTIDSYYRMFLMSKTYRESCYACKFACKQRTSDITLGDFWGGNQEIRKNSKIDMMQGVSCILINSDQGNNAMNLLINQVSIEKTSFENLSKENFQLVHPSNKPANYDKIIQVMTEEPYKEFEKMFRKQQGLEFYYRTLIGFIPYKLKKMIKSKL